MFFEILVLLGILLFVHWWEYHTTVQEYTFSQPATIEKHRELSLLLQEKTPIAVEIGSLPWRPVIAEKATNWTVEYSGGSKRVSEWLTTKEPILNNTDLANQMGLETGLADIDAGRPWWWLPGLHTVSVELLSPTDVLPFSWVTAERSWVGCTHGEPLCVWLVHSRYRQYLPTDAKDPWTLTVADAPWIGRVQYVEVTVKPGWCMGIPAYWGFAAKPLENGDSWIWTADQHSLFSLVSQGIHIK